VAEDIQAVVRRDNEVGRDTSSLLQKNAPLWRDNVKTAKESLSDILESGYDDVKKEAAAKKKVRFSVSHMRLFEIIETDIHGDSSKPRPRALGVCVFGLRW